jgi:2-C-methyl-D-erythritol 2,4-cyclodiphosphate synthase
MRIGQGYDVHAFGVGDALILGGVSIPFDHGFVAHSDGDVLTHALIDAILGALGLGDIGQHFPDTDSQYLDCDSLDLLRSVVTMMRQQGFVIGNADLTIVAQQPKMSPYIDAMRQTLAQVLDSDVAQINVKATTSEGLGFTGRGEGIACHAVVLLIHASNSSSQQCD